MGISLSKALGPSPESSAWGGCHSLAQIQLLIKVQEAALTLAVAGEPVWLSAARQAPEVVQGLTSGADPWVSRLPSLHVPLFQLFVGTGELDRWW